MVEAAIAAAIAGLAGRDVTLRQVATWTGSNVAIGIYAAGYRP